jgi:ABC-2 type transport system permease protein
MRPAVAIFSARFRGLLQYRAAALAGLFTQVFWGGIRMMIFTAFYASTTAQMPMTLDETISYIWLGQAFLLLFPFRADPAVVGMIRDGSVAFELLRPTGLYRLWLARAAATRVAPVMLRCVPMLAVATAVGWIDWAGPAGVLAGLACLLAAVLLSASLSVLMNVSLFWTVSGEGINTLVVSAMFLLSGMIVPLPLLPSPLGEIVAVLPFRGMGDVPFRLLTGAMDPGRVWAELPFQLAWAAGLILLGRGLLGLGLRRLTVQGG